MLKSLLQYTAVLEIEGKMKVVQEAGGLFALLPQDRKGKNRIGKNT